MGDNLAKVKLAAVQASPIFLNREATVEKACNLIKEAGEAGADFVGFPESFIPGHPVWYLFEISAAGSRAMDLATELYKNSVVIPGPETDRLCAAAQEAGVYVVIGLCEKKADQTGTMYNTQLFISPNGTILGKHQKLAPTLTEKMVHTGGTGRYLRTFPTEFGPVSGMICGENTNPLGVAVMAAEYTRIHVASWPHHFMPGHWASMHQSIEIASRNVAYACKAFVIAAAGVVNQEMIDLMAITDSDRAFLKNPLMTGGSIIIDPTGNIIAGPLNGDVEGILYADVDLEQTVRDHFVHDFGGYYNRPDQLHLVVNDAEIDLVERIGTNSGGWCQTVQSSAVTRKPSQANDPSVEAIRSFIDSVETNL
jgi:nitrilase